MSNANCPNPRLEKYDEEPADKQCFYEPTVEQNCSTRTVQDQYPKYRKTCEEIWVKKTFEIEIEGIWNFTISHKAQGAVSNEY